MPKTYLRQKAFTLIELLIVIAIILILVAIALPNFLEAQIRAKVARASGDMRTISIAMETYFLDFKIYPTDHEPDGGNDQRGLFQLTSPIAYLGTIPEDPFSTNTGLIDPNTQEIGWEMASTANDLRSQRFQPTYYNTNVHAWALASQGPDVGSGVSYGSAGGDNFICNGEWPFCGRNVVCSPDPFVGLGWVNYSPTNGTKSKGDIMLPGGEHRSGRYCIDAWHLVVGRYPNIPGLQ
jgi:prepilin-type N-terminal cleavage/methylation domain-containing protein